MATVDKAAFSRELRVWGVRVPKQECQARAVPSTRHGGGGGGGTLSAPQKGSRVLFITCAPARRLNRHLPPRAPRPALTQVALRLLDRQLLDVPRMRAVREVPDNPDYRCVMLHQDVTGQGAQPPPPPPCGQLAPPRRRTRAAALLAPSGARRLPAAAHDRA